MKLNEEGGPNDEPAPAHMQIHASEPADAGKNTTPVAGEATEFMELACKSGVLQEEGEEVGAARSFDLSLLKGNFMVVVLRPHKKLRDKKWKPTACTFFFN